MTVQELVDWCNARGVSLDTHIAMRSKDDYFLVEKGVSFKQAYFGNSRAGMDWEKEFVDWNANEPHENVPKVIILDIDWS